MNGKKYFKKLIFGLIALLLAFGLMATIAIAATPSFAKWQGGSPTVTATVSTGTWQTFKVDYSVNSKAFNPPATVEKATKLTESILSARPTKKDSISNDESLKYHFINWYTDREYNNEAEEDFRLTEDTTLYAKWSVDVTLTDSFGGNESSTENVILNAGRQGSYVYGKIASIPQPEKIPEGYNFGGWWYTETENNISVDKELTTDTEIFTPITCVAKWEKEVVVPQTVTVTFAANGGKFSDGTETQTTEVELGSKLLESQFPAENPVRDGYEFKDWDVVAGTTISAPITVKAQWEEKQTTPDKPTDSNGNDVTPPKFGQGVVITDSTGKAERTVESNLPVATTNLQATITVSVGDLLWFYNGSDLRELTGSIPNWLEKVEGSMCYKVKTAGTYNVNYIPNSGLLQG